MRPFSNYLLARLKQEAEDRTFRCYVSDAILTVNTRKTMLKRLYDILESKPQDNRTGEQIVADIIKGAGLKAK